MATFLIAHKPFCKSNCGLAFVMSNATSCAYEMQTDNFGVRHDQISIVMEIRTHNCYYLHLMCAVCRFHIG